MDGLLNTCIAAFAAAHQWLFEAVVQPSMFALGLANVLDDAYAGTEWFLIGAIELVFIALVIGTLQRLRPLEPIADRHAVRVDMIYTFIHRLGMFRLGMFFMIDPAADALGGWLHGAGMQPLQLDALFPGITDVPVIAFVIYLIVLDFVDYWLHRGQHYFRFWWALHALHHSQRQMTMWSDNRNHLLDDVLVDAAMVLVAAAIGVPPGQFVLLVVASRVLESLQHANVRMSFGRIGERLLVSPRFHRLHHAIGIGHESHGKGTMGGHNFGVLFPWWDMLFGTANFDNRYDATGVRDQVEQGRDYGRGFWAQQRLGLKRMVKRQA
jgi:sterol desaturase/sphingolipid hydroxylase (fatty acid hydroxylase superfamily)